MALVRAFGAEVPMQFLDDVAVDHLPDDNAAVEGDPPPPSVKVPVRHPDVIELFGWIRERSTVKKPTKVPDKKLTDTVRRIVTALEKVSTLERKIPHVGGPRKKIHMEDLLLFQREINACTNFLRRHGASPEHATNIIEPRMKEHKQHRFIGEVINGGYLPALGYHDNDPEKEEFFELHCTNRHCCRVGYSQLPVWLETSLSGSCLAPKNAGFPIGAKAGKNTDTRTTLLTNCRCVLLANAPGSTENRKQSVCGKMIDAFDVKLLEALSKVSPEAREDWVLKATKKMAQHVKFKYGDNRAVDTCPTCEDCRVNEEFVKKADAQEPYIASNLKKCLNTAACGKTYCAVCRQAPYHMNADCPGAQILNMEDMLSSATDPIDRELLRKNIKACPGCNYGVEKRSGCNVMHCPLCMSKFCFGCLAPLHPNFDHEHQCTGSLDGQLLHGHRYYRDPAIHDEGRAAFFVAVSDKTMKAAIPPRPVEYTHPTKSKNGLKQIFVGGVHHF